MSDDNGTERLLGALIQRVTNVEQGIARVESQVREQQRRWEVIEEALRADMQTLRDFTIEVKGGRKVLVALLAVASTLGALAWSIVQRLF